MITTGSPRPTVSTESDSVRESGTMNDWGGAGVGGALSATRRAARNHTNGYLQS